MRVSRAGARCRNHMSDNASDKIGVILNPASGSWKHFPDAGAAAGRARLISQWFAGADSLIYETRGPGDGEAQAAMAAAEGCTLVAARLLRALPLFCYC